MTKRWDEKNFRVFLFVLDPGSKIQDGRKSGSGINIPDPQDTYCPSGLQAEKREGYLAVCYVGLCTVVSVLCVLNL